MRRCIYKKIHYLTFDLGVKVTRNVAQYPLHHVIYASTKYEVATSNGLGGDTITRNVTDGRTDARTDRRTTDRLWYEINIPYFSNEKAGIITKHYTICSEQISLGNKKYTKVLKVYNWQVSGLHFLVSAIQTSSLTP